MFAHVPRPIVDGVDKLAHPGAHGARVRVVARICPTHRMSHRLGNRSDRGPLRHCVGCNWDIRHRSRRRYLPPHPTPPKNSPSIRRASSSTATIQRCADCMGLVAARCANTPIHGLTCATRARPVPCVACVPRVTRRIAGPVSDRPPRIGMECRGSGVNASCVASRVPCGAPWWERFARRAAPHPSTPPTPLPHPTIGRISHRVIAHAACMPHVAHVALPCGCNASHHIRTMARTHAHSESNWATYDPCHVADQPDRCATP